MVTVDDGANEGGEGKDRKEDISLIFRPLLFLLPVPLLPSFFFLSLPNILL